MINSGFKDLDQKTIDYLVKSGVLKAEDLLKLANNDKKKDSSDIYIKDSIREFYEFMRKEYSDNTAIGYRANVESFITYFLNIEKINDIGQDEKLPEVNANNIEKWFAYLIANGYTPASIKRFKHSVKKYFEYISESGYDIPNFENIEIPEQEDAEIEALRDDEIRRLADSANSLRDKVLILFMYEAGMRRQEIIDCKKEHIDFKDNLVKIFNNEKYDRAGYISEECKKLLLQFIEEWEEEVKEINDKRMIRSKTRNEPYRELKVSEYLFQTPRSEQISYSTIFKALKDTAFEYFLNKAIKDGMTEEEAREIAEEKAGKINTDTLRHSRRAYLFSIGKTVDQVQAVMGDENRWLCKRYLGIAQKIYPEKFRG